MILIGYEVMIQNDFKRHVFNLDNDDLGWDILPHCGRVIDIFMYG
jgi:hypothetical protein